ncbi:MAG TPA: branched-chain amino acid ABC transporter permease [Thermoplasmata archaeon]|nr:branched-chain amino acid ABC transporter permease [Thermoplasmata archaeon]
MASVAQPAPSGLGQTLAEYRLIIMGGIIAFIALGLIILGLTGNAGYIEFFMAVAILALIYAIMALSINLQLGYTGLPNAGIIGFFGIGAYCSAIFTADLKMNPIVGIVVGMLASVIFGVAISLPGLRLREDYFAITTIAAAEIFRIVARNERFIGGEFPQLGRFDIPPLIAPEAAWGLTLPQVDKINSFVIVLLCVLLVYAFLQFVVHMTPFGHHLKAIREDEDAAKALGKNTTRYRLTSFALGSAIASFAGSLYAHTQHFITPFELIVFWTFLVWTMMLLGGIGNNRGVIIGAFVLRLITDITIILKDSVRHILDPNQLASLVQMIIGILIMVVVLFLPQGVFKERKVTTAMVTEATDRSGYGPPQKKGVIGWISWLLRA